MKLTILLLLILLAVFNFIPLIWILYVVLGYLFIKLIFYVIVFISAGVFVIGQKNLLNNYNKFQ